MAIYRLAKGQGQELWTDAEPVETLANVLRSVGGGDEVLIGFDRDQENPVFWREVFAELRNGGQPQDHLKISFGFKSDPSTVVPPSRATGWPMFRRRNTAAEGRIGIEGGGKPFLDMKGPFSNVSISGPFFTGAAARGFFRLDGEFKNLVFSHVHGNQAGRVIECEDDCSIDGLLVQDCSAFGLNRGFARFQELSNAVFRNLDLDAGLSDGSGRSVCQIIAVDGGSNLRFDNVRFANAVNAINAEERGSTYIQGDGLVLEEETRDVQITNCVVQNMGDGGFDLKTEGVQLKGCVASGCKYGIRIWTDNPNNLISGCSISAPSHWENNTGACLWVGGSVRVLNSRLSASERGFAVYFGKSKVGTDRVVEIRGGTIELGPGSTLAGGEPGEVILKDVLWNGKRESGSVVWDGRSLSFR